MPTTGHDKYEACLSKTVVSCSNVTLLGRDQDRSSESFHAQQTTWNTTQQGVWRTSLRRGLCHPGRRDQKLPGISTLGAESTGE
jgi:hypothetical protein